MCGIAGIFNLHRNEEISLNTLKGMIAMIQHRGPDGLGFYSDDRAGLAHARLSIIDLNGGWQPIHNENKTVWTISNGVIFNYKELRRDLEKKGHRFYTMSDTEVIIHLYEDHGANCVTHLNGQFAFAIWDKKKEALFVARDRVGIRPLFYTIVDGTFLFASEVKSLFMDSRVSRALDPYALDQTFTFWMTIPPRTAFKDVFELPPGHYLKIEKGKITTARYWNLDFQRDGSIRTEQEYAEELRELLIDSTRLQLRADVPVGAYLSGGIDSSVIATLIKKYTDTPLRTFSVTFADETYDESGPQRQMIKYLGADHTAVHCANADIGGVFSDVVWHAEKPVLRTAAAPLYLLSKLVRESGYKVVLTGEGSDEILAGYDIFKEVKVRRFLERYPRSKFRPLIMKRLYSSFANSPAISFPYAESFLKADTAAYPAEYYSHVPRWKTTSMAKMFFSSNLKDTLQTYGSIDDLSQFLSGDLRGVDDISRAQHIEIKTLLSGYLLSSQGDRVAMAHSIEGRFPFLDHRLIEFCCKLPSTIRMRALTEKYILKKCMKDILPASIIARTKQPYMAPDAKSFFNGKPLAYIDELLSEKYLEASGYFDAKAVPLLVKKCRNNAVLGFKDNLAMVGIISTLLVHDHFIKNFDVRRKQITEQRTEASCCKVEV